MSLKKYDRGTPLSVTMSSSPSAVRWRPIVRHSPRRTKVQIGSSIRWPLIVHNARRALTERRRRPAVAGVAWSGRARTLLCSQSHQHEPREECAVARVPEIELSVLRTTEHDAGHDGNRLDDRAVAKEGGHVHGGEREPDGHRG